jgi:hypothetical protein
MWRFTETPYNFPMELTHYPGSSLDEGLLITKPSALLDWTGIYSKVPPDLSKFTTADENTGGRRHKGRDGARPSTKNRIFMKAFHAPMGAPRMMKIPSDGGEGAGDGGRRAPGVGLNPKSVAFKPPWWTCGHEALSKLYPLQGRGFSRVDP